MVAKRRKIQMELAFDVGSRGEAPSTGDKGTEATMAKSRTESSASTIDTLTCPNRRVRDPYARWCGRRGAARRPPIPIAERVERTAAFPTDSSVRSLCSLTRNDKLRGTRSGRRLIEIRRHICRPYSRFV